jgi:type VI secretion system protein
VKHRAKIGIIFGLFFLISCGAQKRAAKSVGLSNFKKFSVQIAAARNANQNHPIPVDLVIVSDKKLGVEIGKFSAKDWFDRRLQVQRDFPDAARIMSWEWVPGQRAGPIDVQVSPKAIGAYIFANYLSGGDQRAKLELKSPVIINLNETSFSVQPLR